MTNRQQKQALKTWLSFILIRVKEVAKGQTSLNVFQPRSYILQRTMNSSWLILMKVKHSIHLLNHKGLKRTSLRCRLMLSFSFNIFFYLVNVSSCRLSSHYPFMINKPHSKLLEMPFGNLTRRFGKVHNLIRETTLK